MEDKKYIHVVIDRLEYYITKEIERAIYGDGKKHFVAFNKRIIEYMNARKEIGYEPIYESVEEFLYDYGYDDKFIQEFISKPQVNLDDNI